MSDFLQLFFYVSFVQDWCKKVLGQNSPINPSGDLNPRLNNVE